MITYESLIKEYGKKVLSKAIKSMGKKKWFTRAELKDKCEAIK